MKNPHIVDLATSPMKRTGGTQSTNTPTADVVVGLGGGRRNAGVAAVVDGQLGAFCEQERITRVRRMALESGTLPQEALDIVLHTAGRFHPDDVRLFIAAEDTVRLPPSIAAVRIGHHFAHAATAFYLSPFDKAAVLVCDNHSSERLSVWSAADGRLASVDWPCNAIGFATLYSECSTIFGFLPRQEHQLEALAKVGADNGENRLSEVIGYANGELWARPRWKAVMSDWLADAGGSLDGRARVANAFQCHLGGLLRQLLVDVRRAVDAPSLCLGGGLFYNTYFNTVAHEAALFDSVFVAPNPGNAGIGAGAALAVTDTHASRRRGGASPFLGPEYDQEDIKSVLDNCKLSYEYLTESKILAEVADALRRGRLVGWFQGRMEWAHRALGNRSILASPLSPYVLENLNRFLKRRQAHRAYGLSVCQGVAACYFSGPPNSNFMEYEYRLNDPHPFRHAVPCGATSLRVQTVPEDSTDESVNRFVALHKAVGDMTGVPVLVNTSFNGLGEPIVCSPRDALRVFFSTGLDMIVLDHFVIRK